MNAWLLIGAGFVLSLIFIIDEFRASRSTEPYAGTGRLGPEFHFVPALLSGVGGWLAWGWLVGAGLFVAQTILFMLVAFRLRAA